jgi:IS5 family transposase
VQRHLGRHPWQRLHQKVRCAHPGLDCAEGMLDRLAPLAHFLRTLVEPALHRLKNVLGNPYDGRTLHAAIEGTERLTGCQIERAYVDKGYRGHDAPNPHRVFISGQKRGVFGAIKRELRRRSAIEPVIGHMKAEGHLGRCYLKGTAGDAANAILTAIGHNLRLVLAWLRILLCLILAALSRTFTAQPRLKLAS